MHTIITASSPPGLGSAPYVSIGIIAWNEQDAIAPTITSLLRQTLFERLASRHLVAEIVCVANGCTDATVAVATKTFSSLLAQHTHRDHIIARVADLSERGKVHAWNQFVHSISARESRFLFLMDADIIIHRPQTLANMLQTLEQDQQASVSVDRPCKHLEFQARKSCRDRLSLAAAQMTTAAPAQLCGQLYCMRSDIARSIYLPRDLSACEDGLIKVLVCTDLLTQPVNPGRIQLAPDAAHTFEAYTSPADILKNQKRQTIGQTLIHILVDQHLKRLSLPERINLAETLRNREASDPHWLRKLTAEHLRQTRYFWRLYPGLVRHRFTRLKTLPPLKRLACLPAAAAGSCAGLAAAFLASRHLKRGLIEYWPQARRAGLDPLEPATQPQPPAH
ncbi:MAG TPA: glycosyltransferase [Clostridia bacterium]|nr:glycosyltransferase [Clostridia bacterium]